MKTIDLSTWGNFHIVIIDDYSGKWLYGFRKKRPKETKPPIQYRASKPKTTITLESDLSEPRGWNIDFSWLKFWELGIFKDSQHTPRK